MLVYLLLLLSRIVAPKISAFVLWNYVGALPPLCAVTNLLRLYFFWYFVDFIQYNFIYSFISLSIFFVC